MRIEFENGNYKRMICETPSGTLTLGELEEMLAIGVRERQFAEGNVAIDIARAVVYMDDTTARMALAALRCAKANLHPNCPGQFERMGKLFLAGTVLAKWLNQNPVGQGNLTFRFPSDC